MAEPHYNYDDECEVLALHFLVGPRRPDPKDISDLAQALQDAVEMWFAGRSSESLPSSENVPDVAGEGG